MLGVPRTLTKYFPVEWFAGPLVLGFGGKGVTNVYQTAPSAPKTPAPPTPPNASEGTAATRALVRDVASQRSYQTTVLTRLRDKLIPGQNGIFANSGYPRVPAGPTSDGGAGPMDSTTAPSSEIPDYFQPSSPFNPPAEHFAPNYGLPPVVLPPITLPDVAPPAAPEIDVNMPSVPTGNVILHPTQFEGFGAGFQGTQVDFSFTTQTPGAYPGVEGPQPFTNADDFINVGVPGPFKGPPPTYLDWNSSSPVYGTPSWNPGTPANPKFLNEY